MRDLEMILQNLAQGTAAVTGDQFFRSLVRHLVQALGVSHAFVTEVIDERREWVRVLAIIVDGDFADPFDYALDGTPCQAVIGGEVIFYPRGLRDAFPDKPGESYLGIPIVNAEGLTMGHIAIMDRQPMTDELRGVWVLQIFAARAGAEIERKRSESEREQAYQLLEQRVEARTHEIEQRRQIAESLRDILTVLNSNRPLDEILDHIVAEASRLLNSQASAICHLDERQHFQMQTMQGATTVIADFEFPPLLRDILLNGEPFAYPDHDQPDSEAQILMSNLGITCCAFLSVPLVVADAVYGCLVLYYTTARQFSNEEIELAVAFADQAALAIENARLRQSVQQTAVLEERGRLARELHDSVTQSLYSLTLLAEGWRRLAKVDKLEDTVAALAELGEIAQQGLKEMRLLVHELRSPALASSGLVGALHQRLSDVEKRAGVDARLIADDLAENLPPHVEEELYRLTQEALNNALKHASATHVTVRLKLEGDQLELDITDDGCGFDPSMAAEQGGIGLSSMRERAARLGGTLNIASKPGEGTRVHVSVRVAL